MYYNIYVTGPLGFLSTQDEHCPGNIGLKDQQEALRFLQKTVESFGGDKNSVTIFGESAGGASVHYHMISKTSVGKYFSVSTYFEVWMFKCTVFYYYFCTSENSFSLTGSHSHLILVSVWMISWQNIQISYVISYLYHLWI